MWCFAVVLYIYIYRIVKVMNQISYNSTFIPNNKLYSYPIYPLQVRSSAVERLKHHASYYSKIINYKHSYNHIDLLF